VESQHALAFHMPWVNVSRTAKLLHLGRFFLA
jgi:hypothetical protein